MLRATARRSSFSTLPQHQGPLIQRRPFLQFLAGGGGGGGKFLFVGAALVSGFLVQAFLRSSFNQKRSLKKAFGNTLPPPAEASPIPPFRREVEAATLRRFFEADAGGFFAITGAYGSGKDFLLQEALQGRPNVVHFDVRQTPVTTPDEFMYHLLRSLGYRLPYFERMVRGILRERGPRKLVEALEMDRFVKVFTEFLQKEKQRRRQSDKAIPIPVLLVTGLENLNTTETPAKKDKEKEKDKDGDKKKEEKAKVPITMEGPDPGLAKFFDLCVHCVDQGLAIVALSTTRQFLHSQIDSDYRLRLKREVFDIGYPSVPSVRDYLQNVVKPRITTRLNNDPALVQSLDEEMGKALEIIGPNLAHLHSLVSAMSRGVPAGIAAVRLHRDAAMHITTHLEGLLAEPKRFQAVWDLFTELVKHPVPRHETIGELFGNDLQDFYTLERNCIIRISYNRFPPTSSSEGSFGLRDDLEDAWVEPYSALEHAALKSVLQDTMLSSYAEKNYHKLKTKKLRGELSELMSEVVVLEGLINSGSNNNSLYSSIRDRRLNDLRQTELALEELEEEKLRRKEAKKKLSMEVFAESKEPISLSQ